MKESWQNFSEEEHEGLGFSVHAHEHVLCALEQSKDVTFNAFGLEVERGANSDRAHQELIQVGSRSM